MLYLDALGAALFAVTAADKVLVANIAGPVAVIMGVLTAIGGGLIRDVLAGRPTLLMSREIYATPILLGCIVFVALRSLTPQFPYLGARRLCDDFRASSAGCSSAPGNARMAYTSRTRAEAGVRPANRDASEARCVRRRNAAAKQRQRGAAVLSFQ